ncbi:MAG: hypothetical protein EZS28_014613 [Streblomastix strix]|uniref:Uncharacterized protein n=1 Tax=Streblomastix strix TaxID=222440 RepID=A0A5J4W5Y9_9EUKA|nr:MAG: hypothetical protein EZS28_014613 [Streblomastix strix]
MPIFEPLSANITIAIDALEQLHIDCHAIFKTIWEAAIKYACESKLCSISFDRGGKMEDIYILLSKCQKQASTFAYYSGGGDMLVSSQVNQIELQEVRDIASGKSKAYVFDTQSDLNDWMAIQDNVAKLVIGDNLYIVDKQIVDYWWDGTDLKVQETEQPDKFNVITTLGTATGGGNAISDLSFSGNTLISAKNINFVTTDYDQNISGSNTFTSTIHSVGIQIQNYDNLSVTLAGGGVKAIQDINVSVDLSDYYNKSQTYSQTEIDQKLNLKLNISDQIDAYIKTQDDALLILKADKSELIDAYNKTEVDALLDDKLNVSDQIDAYTKQDDDVLLLLKADKTQKIDAYTKGEINNLLNYKADSGVSCTKGENDALLLKADKTQLIDSYTKQEDDALLLLKADKTQLIDAYTKGETNNLLNNKADSEVSYTKQEDNALLFLKANQSTTYIKTETDYLISQIDVSDVDLSGYYSKIQTNELFDEKAATTDLSNYVSLGTAQTITANKTFNNVCRFISSIDGMATITGASFVKSGTDDIAELLGADGTKSISEFGSGSIDDSNYVKKTGYELQIIHGVLRRDDEELSMSEAEEDYLTRREIYNAFVSRYDNQTIYGSKTFNSNINAAGFTKTVKDDTSVLLAGGGDQLLSDFSSGGATVEILTSQIAINETVTGFNYSSLAFVKLGNLYLFQIQATPKQEGFAPSMNIKLGTLPTQYAPTVSELCMSVGSPYGGFKPHITNTGEIRCYTIGASWIEQISFSGLLDAAGLSDFPELYAYIKERYPKPLEQQPHPVPIGDQTFQQQVKNNDDIIYASNQEFEPPVPNAITKLDLSSQLERQSFLASSGSDPQLIVYGDRITLTASYSTTGLFPSGGQLGGQLSGYLFKSYPPETRPKAGDQVIALVGTGASNTYNIFCYFDQNGPYIICNRQIPSNTVLMLNIIYYKSYESSKKINFEANNDGKIDIIDTWNVNGKGQFEAQSYVYETAKKQTELIEAGIQGLNRTNYLNNEIKLMDELAIYKAN